MNRKSGRASRLFSRLFKERQIYHRSDGVVHFISMSTKTQIALAAVAGCALLWVAYASVNVVFKEQIIVEKDAERREIATTFSKRMHEAQRAYDDVNSLNFIMQREFDATMGELSNRHHMLKNMVERKAAVDQTLDMLSTGLSEAGAPNGQRPSNGNRIMIDPGPGEATPRRSRLSGLRIEAQREASMRQSDIPENSPVAGAMGKMENAAAQLYTEQMLLLASLEERANAQVIALRRVLDSTGVESDRILLPAKISNIKVAQGGPFYDLANMNGEDSKFFDQANRANMALEELEAMKSVISKIPLSSPLTVSRRYTSSYGVRRDPINGRRANHFGIDFAAAWRSPITATAAGTITYAGSRSGFGRVVEITHGNGFVTRYAHMNRISVKKGQKVALHTKVGELGNSGRSTGPHVHYEVLYKGRPVNPRRFIEAGRYVFES